MPARPTIIDVARRAGVSKSTVSRVLQGDGASVSDATRHAVRRAIKQLGYERNAIARSLRTRRTDTVMAITPDITNPFWAEVARGMQDTLEHAGVSVVVGNSDWDVRREHALLASARRSHVDGLAINPAGITPRELRARGIPTVILGIGEGFESFDMVGSDTYGGARAALDYLYTHGHRRIGFIRGRHASGAGLTRLNAYRDSLRAHDLPFDESLVVEVPFDLPGGRCAMQTLLALPHPPSAVFAANDILAIGAMQVAGELGLRIPADVSLIGMDDIYPAALTTPALTTIAKPKYETGCRAAGLLLERIECKAPKGGRRVLLPCALVERGSVAPPGQSEMT